MKIINKIKQYLVDRGFFNYIPDEEFLKKKYFKVFHKELDLKNPKLFTEKLQWLKLNYRDKVMTKLVDKCEVKEYIDKEINDNNLKTIPTLGVYNKFSDIDFDKLPDKFVIKCTHDSGSVTVVKDKKKLKYLKEKIYFDLKLKCNFYNRYREWPYKNVKPRIIIEKFMEDDKSDALTDYKFFCFNGEPKFMYISKDESKDPRTDFFDMDFNHLDMHLKDPNADVVPTYPKEFEEMKRLTKKLAKNFPFVRVDFYVINNTIYFGEFTFYHLGGFFKFHPEDWDLRLGNLLDIKKDDKK